MKATTRLISLLSLAVAACGGGAEQSPVMDACLVTHTEPIVLITSATDTVSQQSLGTITLSNLQVNGMAVDLAALTATSFGVTVSGSSLQCTLPCGFSSMEGKYSFMAVAPGYQAAAVTVDAHYSTKSGGSCTLTLSGGTKVAVGLKPN